MRTVYTILLLALLLPMTGGCDFPSDPPIRDTDDTVDPLSSPAQHGDLLPLKPRHRWIYVADPYFRPSLSPTSAIARERVFGADTFYYLPYAFIPTGEKTPVPAFPPLLRNDSTGLQFYDPGIPGDTLRLRTAPIHRFTLPHPARLGAKMVFADQSVSVQVTAVDTLVSMRSFSSILLPCTRYEVTGRGRSTTTFYILPGICILRIETEHGVYHTVSWYLS